MMAETIVIKSPETADAINAHVDLYHSEVNLDDPYSWKYYMNLAGEPHASDTPMEVVSLDTLQKIAFTKANLVRHRATARGYVYGTRYYRELVARFPDQEMLILGILYPTDKKTAVEANDCQILRILPGLVEENEYSFVTNLQRWLYGMRLRWVNKEYAATNNLYMASALGLRYAMLLPAIMMQRKAACLTNEAHSYHVRQYLLSHGLKDKDIDHLTLKQSLWLYRNIKHLRKNAGQTETFTTLIEHILTERLVPLADYTMRHDLAKMPDNFYPDLTFRRNALNLGYSVNSLDNIGLQQLLDKEDPVARDNPRIKEDAIISIANQMENSRSNVLMTKVLESVMVDYTNSEFYNFEDILVNEWLYLSVNNMYVTAIQVLHPLTGERIPMLAKDAYAVMLWLYAMSLGWELTDVPSVVANRVQRLSLPTTDEMLSVVDQRLVKRELAQFALEMNPIFSQIISIEEFNDTCHEIFIAANKQRDLYAYQEHMDARAYVQNMVGRIYTDAVCPLSMTGETYKQMFARLNFNTAGLEQGNYVTMWKDIMRDATGLSLSTTKSVKDMQRAMIRIMKQLSSYSVQFISDINEGAIISTDYPGVRVGDSGQSVSGTIEVPDLGVRVNGGRQHVRHVVDFNINGCRLRSLAFAQSHATGQIELPQLIHEDKDGVLLNMNLDAVPVRFKFETPYPSQDQTEGSFPMPGIESFLQMSQEDRLKLAEEWEAATK
jgi:hypothetical protein